MVFVWKVLIGGVEFLELFVKKFVIENYVVFSSFGIMRNLVF